MATTTKSSIRVKPRLFVRLTPRFGVGVNPVVDGEFNF
jgi:hypothetical protein